MLHPPEFNAWSYNWLPSSAESIS